MVWLMTLALVVITVFGVIILAVRAHLRSRIEAERDAIRALGYPATLAELATVYGTPPPGPNGADHFRKLPGLFVGSVMERQEHLGFLKMGSLASCQVLGQDVVNASTVFLDDNRPYLEELRRGLAIETCHFGHDLTRPDTVHMSEIRTLGLAAHVLHIDGRLLAENGDLPGASARVLEILETADRTRDGPTLVHHMLCTAKVNDGLDLLKAILCRGPVPEDAAAEISRRLADAEAWITLDRLVVPELCGNQHLFLHSDSFRSSVCASSGPFGAGWPDWDEVRNRATWGAYTSSGMRESDYLQSLRYFRELLEAAPLPESRRLARVRDIQDRLDASGFRRRYFRNTELSLGRDVHMAYEHRALCRCARAALAVDRYHKQHGALPDSLDAVVPEYLEQVPIDPFAGGPVRYVRRENGFVVYSVGENGTDDGGFASGDVPYRVKQKTTERTRPIHLNLSP